MCVCQLLFQVCAPMWAYIYIYVYIYICNCKCVTACLCQICIHEHMCWRNVKIGCFLACFDLPARFDLKLFWVLAVERLMSFWNHEVASCPWCCSSMDVLHAVVDYMTVGAIVRPSSVFCLTTRHCWMYRMLQHAACPCTVHPDAPASSFNQPDNSSMSSDLYLMAGQLAHFWHTRQICTLCDRHATPLQVVGRRLVASRPPVGLSGIGPGT